MRGICKSFPGVRALSDASLEVARGECHALVGENGAGKSTLMKILAGAFLPDAGEIHLDGRPARIASPLDARRAGISMIYQEPSLLPELTVAENIFLGREPRRRFGRLDRRRMLDESRAWLSRLQQPIDPARPARDLPLAGQQMVEIVRALSLEARVMVMDEPSAILTDVELETLFGLMARLRSEGLAIVYISHRLDEIFRNCDRVTVMRDGRTVGTQRVAEVTQSELVRAMVGRDVTRVYPELPEPGTERVLELRGVARPPRVREVSLEVRRGEIVGLAGLVGAGRTEVARLVFGADRPACGTIVFEGRPLVAHDPGEAIRRGIGLLTEDRSAQGLLLDLTLRENITLPALAALGRAGFVSRRRERAEVRPLIEELRIKAPGPEERAGNLSGGNQQKTILARWLHVQSRLLIFDEPTRGIDVGARAEIYRLIVGLAARGRSILVISSELQELVGLCHRIYVMRDGGIAGELAAPAATEERLLALAMGVSRGGAS
jgi:ABC-type sugar transport system ATPase subunit